MVRTEWCVLLMGAGVLVACGSGGGNSAGPEPDPATSIAPPTSTSQTAAAPEWTMPTGVFRSESPQTGVLDLHLEPGDLRIYDVTDGSPDLGYAADCVTDAPSTATCTESSGLQLVFTWSGTSDRLELTFVDGFADDERVLEAAPWVRVP